MRLTKKRKQEIRRLYNMGTPVNEIAALYEVPECKVIEIVLGKI